MNTRILAVAILAALAGRAALAASEGGDTWSATAPSVYSASSLVQSAPSVDPAVPGSLVAASASEGGDTWSDLQPTRRTTVGAEDTHEVAAQTGALYAGVSGGSEGGDTWSRFVPSSFEATLKTASIAVHSKL